MIHVYDQDFALKVAEGFREAYMAHIDVAQLPDPRLSTWVGGRPRWRASSLCNGSSSTP